MVFLIRACIFYGSMVMGVDEVLVEEGVESEEKVVCETGKKGNQVF